MRLPPGAPVYVAHGLQADDLAYAGSLAKQVTGACAALLVQDGSLSVEAPIGPWLPELPGWAQAVRVRHLLHHTAGLPSIDTVWESMESAGEQDWTSDGVMAALSTMPDLERVPGTAYAYSNVGYVCLARIIERLSAGVTAPRNAPAAVAAARAALGRRRGALDDGSRSDSLERRSPR